MAENKRQHYVPQLYLKNFSVNKNLITVFSIKENKIVTHSAPIDRQCYENYLYSTDLKFEKSLSTLESLAKPIFEEILTLNKIPLRTDKKYHTLLVFILYQSARTLFALDQLNDHVDKLTKTLLKEEMKRTTPEDITVEDLNEAIISIKEPGVYSLSIISQMVPLLLDLKCKLLVNKTSKEFITSDNPVVLYNKLFFNNAWNYNGFACKGLMIFFPLNPAYCLIYYDSDAYKLRSKSESDLIDLKNLSDINDINILQMGTAYKTIYTLNMKDDYLKFISQIASKYRFVDKTILHKINVGKDDDGTESQIIWSSRAKIRFNFKASFVTIRRDNQVYFFNKSIVRNQELVDLQKEFTAKITENEYNVNEWNKFLSDKISKI